MQVLDGLVNSLSLLFGPFHHESVVILFQSLQYLHIYS